MYVLLAVLSAFCMALHLVMMSREMRHNPACTPLVAMGCANITSGVLLMIPLALQKNPQHYVQVEFYIFLAIAVLITMISKTLYLYAYKHVEVAFVTVFSALTPVVTIFSGWLFLHEMPSTTAIAGTLIICSAVYYLFLQHRPHEGGVLTRIFWPFLLVLRNPPVLCAFLSVLPPALSVIFQKRSALLFDPLHYAFYATWLEGMLAFVIAAIKSGPQAVAAQLKQLSPVRTPLLGITLCLAQVSSTAALTYGLAANVMALQRIGILFQITLAYFLLGQTEHMPRKYVTAALILCGFFLIASHG